MDESNRPYSVFWPLLLIAAGVFLLLNALGLIQGDFWGVFLRLWPLLFIVGGLDSLYRRESFVGPILFIGLGTVILLSNLGYVQLASWTVFLRLWPVLLIAFGLDILIGHRTVWSAVAGVALGLLLVAGVFWYASTLPEANIVESEAISQPLGEVQAAEIDLGQIFGDMNISGGASSNLLIEGQVQLGRNQTFNQDYIIRNERGVYTFNSTTADAYFPFINPATSPVWNLNLTGDVPLSLDLSLVIGSQHIDLTGVNVERIETSLVIGQTRLILSEGDPFEGSTSTVIGQVVVVVPRDVPLRIQLSTALTGTSFPNGFTREDDVVYNQAAGLDGEAIELELSVPLGSVRIEYTD
jgi:hypothetical protein